METEKKENLLKGFDAEAGMPVAQMAELLLAHKRMEQSDSAARAFGLESMIRLYLPRLEKSFKANDMFAIAQWLLNMRAEFDKIIGENSHESTRT